MKTFMDVVAVACVCLGVFLISPEAYAGGWEVGFSYANSYANPNPGLQKAAASAASYGFVTKTSEGLSSTNGTLFVGYRFSPSFGVRVGSMNLGIFNSSLRSESPVVTSVESENMSATADYLAVTGTYPITDKIRLTGQIGLARLKVVHAYDYADNTGNVRSSSGSYSGSSPMYGVSVGYAVTDTLTVQATAGIVTDVGSKAATWPNADLGNVGFIGLGLVYRQ